VAVGKEGVLFVISAPSGTGKSTVARALLERVPNLVFSVSYTTRPPREGEREGRDYHFVQPEVFERMIRSGALLEWADVFGERYGTGRADVERTLAAGSDVLLDIDVQGARQVRGSGVPSVTIMLLPPDHATLAARLRSRGSESDEALERRLARARTEVEEFGQFDYVVVNDQLEESVLDLCAILRAEHRRAPRAAARAQAIVASFPHAGQTAKEH